MDVWQYLSQFRRARPDDGARQRVAEWARAAGGYDAETVIKVSEIVCADPTCPGLETVILVMEPGRRTQARKIRKAVAETSEADIIHAFSA